MSTVAETLPFQKKAARLLTDSERHGLIVYLSFNPQAGVLIEGTGGVRKLRWGRSGMGKSGGVRVIYYFHSERHPLYLLTVFGKSEQTNLSKAEKAMLKATVKELVKSWRVKNGQGV